MKAIEIFNKQIETKAAKFLEDDFSKLHDNFQSTLEFTMHQVANGCVESYQQMIKLIEKGHDSIPFNKLSESIQEYYLKKALEG